MEKYSRSYRRKKRKCQKKGKKKLLEQSQSNSLLNRVISLDSSYNRSLISFKAFLIIFT